MSTTNCETTNPHKKMRYWMSQEFARVRMLLLTAAFFMFFYAIPFFTLHHKSSVIFIFLGITLFLFVLVLLPRILCTKFMVKHSAIGRQIKAFGDFDTVYREILAAVGSPLYTNGTELISENYIFLMPEPAKSAQLPAFQSKGRLFILPVKWLSRVSIKPNEPYPDEMNTVLFRLGHLPANASTSNGLYTMTVHMGAEETAKLVTTINACMSAADSTGQSGFFTGKSGNPASNSSFSGRYTAGSSTQSAMFETERVTNAYPSKPKRTPAARSAARFRSNPLHELRAGKMRVLRLIVSFIVLVNVGMLLWIYFISGGSLSTLPQDFIHFIHRELLPNPQYLFFVLGLLAIYLVPTLSIYIMIRRWYHGFMEQYEKLPQPEQQELLKQLCDNFETGQPAIIYTEHCFCFRNMRCLSFQTLVPYASVLWIYRAHSTFPVVNSVPGLETQVDFYYLVIRTDHRKKYRIAYSDGSKLSKRVPDAITGYGDIQKETYFDKLRSLK